MYLKELIKVRISNFSVSLNFCHEDLTKQPLETTFSSRVAGGK